MIVRIKHHRGEQFKSSLRIINGPRDPRIVIPAANLEVRIIVVIPTLSPEIIIRIDNVFAQVRLCVPLGEYNIRSTSVAAARPLGSRCWIKVCPPTPCWEFSLEYRRP